MQNRKEGRREARREGVLTLSAQMMRFAAVKACCEQHHPREARPPGSRALLPTLARLEVHISAFRAETPGASTSQGSKDIQHRVNCQVKAFNQLPG